MAQFTFKLRDSPAAIFTYNMDVVKILYCYIKVKTFKNVVLETRFWSYMLV